MSLEALFADFPKVRLENDPAVIFALDAGLRLIYVNPAWYRFAAENGVAADELTRKYFGQSIQLVIPGALRDFYAAVYRHVLKKRECVQHTYECSSADRYRLMHMRLLPLRGGAGILCVNSVVSEGPHTRDSSSSNDQAYLEDGLVNMCSSCRRTRRAQTEIWDWVPDYVDDPPFMVSYGLCPICHSYYRNIVEAAQIAGESI